ncbi:MAG: DUF1802 family protein [Planctomycetes bacterium]|nr:DUF1802 family protein [Planctomycetota bacterium]
MLQHAFKEWAVICEALARGTQALILRKGGIAEVAGEFAVEHTRFWLYPTFSHQQKDGIQEDARPLLEHVEANRPLAGTVQLQTWVEVDGVYSIRDELTSLLLSHLHIWSEATVAQRFNYRTPGLFLLVARVYRITQPHVIDESPAYAGCKSWLELDHPLSTDGSTPVLADADFDIVKRQLSLLLAPTAYA